MRRRLGLRPRLLAALLAASLVTLGAAAIVLLPPLRERLRTESVRSTSRTTDAQVGAINDAIGKRDCPEVDGLLFALAQQATARVFLVDIQPAPLCGSDDPVAGGDILVQTALNEGVRQQVVRDNNLEIVAPLGRDGKTTSALIVRKPLRDVSGAVEEVRKAFETAAIIGLIAALVLGLVLSSTMVRRLDRLRRAAQRVTREGAGAPRPHDEGTDEIGDLARSFATMQDALLRQEEARRAFVATASHELRTPLTSLSGMLELLDEDLAEGRLDTADAREQIASARRELRRLGNLAAELLDLSRLDAGVPLRSEPIELGELTRAVASEFEQRAGDSGVPLEVVPPMGPCWAKGDPGAVARVLRILLDNALRFSPPGDPIRIAAHYYGDRAVVEVSDQGPGVPASERELIFERFQRGSHTGGEGGFGLGLAIGRELAEKLGGTLTLRQPDATHRGAWFVCELPIELPSGGHPEPRPERMRV